MNTLVLVHSTVTDILLCISDSIFIVFSLLVEGYSSLFFCVDSYVLLHKHRLFFIRKSWHVVQHDI